jgi:predicted MPP superfamily phosphohydrolase
MASLPQLHKPTTAQPARRARRARRFPPEVHYSPRWLGAGAALSALALLGVRYGGPQVAAALGLAGSLGVAYASLFEPARPLLERVTLPLPTLPAALDGLRIGQITDLHLGGPYNAANVRWAVAQMRRAQPDLLVLTGDFVSRHAAVPELKELLGGLHAPLGMYAVPGNHDYYEGIEDITATLTALGVEMLLNRSVPLRWGQGVLWLLGLDDVWEGEANLDAALAGLPPQAFSLLLCHVPDFVEQASQRGIAVQLSGHTHGGHLRLPLLGAFCVPRHGLRYQRGLAQVGATTLYVSRGIGGMPLRFGCAPEATIFTLRRA